MGQRSQWTFHEEGIHMAIKHLKRCSVWLIGKVRWSRSVASDSAIPRTVAYQAFLSIGFSRQEYWSGCHFLLQWIFPTRDRTQISCIVGRRFTIWATREVGGRQIQSPGSYHLTPVRMAISENLQQYMLQRVRRERNSPALLVGV